MLTKAHSPFNSPIRPVQKSDGEWRLTVGYCGLNEVTQTVSADELDLLELQYERESKAVKWYATTGITNVFFLYSCSPTICHRLIHTALDKGRGAEHLQYIDNIIVWR